VSSFSFEPFVLISSFMSRYEQRGVSAQKEEVHAATKSLDKGLYSKAFCKIYKDVLGGDRDWVNVLHADGAGTKSILAYLYWKQTGDLSVWKGIAQDAIVMNLDDLLCVGICNNFLYSSSIDRNKKRIPGAVLQTIIEGSQEFFDAMKGHGVHIEFMGGETADVGDVVRTIAVNGTMGARWPKKGLVTNEKIGAGNVVVGLASYGQSTYEMEYNSGIGSNGLTSARHDVLKKLYAEQYPESFDDALNDDVVYTGTYDLTDEVEIAHKQTFSNPHIGKLLLSPTRTFAPVVKQLLEEQFQNIYGLIHCSGGGQTKCMKYVPDAVHVIKDKLFDVPQIFQIIQECSGADDREMCQVFNMGCRLEVYTSEKAAQAIMDISKSYGIDAQVIGRVEASDTQLLTIKKSGTEIQYRF
jgi:phosphoribosylformylglycinamidine cyclo-ligase